MNVRLLLALALPLGCLALLSAIALLGVLVLAAALHGVGIIGASLKNWWRGMSYSKIENQPDAGQ
jgi:uncharacterized membrane protein AbrB (regulator of aidB expression)